MRIHYDREVYFILSKKCRAIKIGISLNAKMRIREIQSMCPDQLITLAVMDGTPRFEGDLHKSLRSERIHGEWFKVSERTYDILFHYLGAEARSILLSTPYHDSYREMVEMPIFDDVPEEI